MESEKWEVGSQAAAHPNEGTAVAVGDSGPDFALANTDGRVYQLSTAGATTLLIFYRGDW